MNAAELRREQRSSHRTEPHARARGGGSRSAWERGCRPSSERPLEEPASVPASGRSRRLWWAALWSSVAAALVGLGFAIGAWLESGLLGFLGADFLFLVVASFFTAGQSGSSRSRSGE